MKKIIYMTMALLIIPQIGQAKLTIGNIVASEELQEYSDQLDSSQKILESSSLSYEELVKLYHNQFVHSSNTVIENELKTTENLLNSLLESNPEADVINHLKAKTEALKNIHD